MLAKSGFAEQNPVSKEIERLLETFRDFGVSFDEELRPLTRAYRQMEAAFTGAVSSAEKMDILRTIYEGFFQAAMKDTVKRVGIVYTPVQIVDFMVRSAAAICQKEFGRSIGSENLHILDPFVGTGTFLARLIEMKDEDDNYLISFEDLDRKYKHELHANEFILLAYYIAALKIEEAKHSRDSEMSNGEVDYQTYENIVLTDTLRASPEQQAFDAFQENIKAAQKQDSTPMTVILANPPWSAGQKSTGDDNPNIKYPAISDRVSQTYGVKHREVTGRGIGKAAGNLYVKALRWCSDRVLPNEQRGNHPAIVGLVHPNSLTDGTSLIGARAMLREDFTDIYVVNLRGNAYKSGEEFRKEGDKIFGGGSRNGVQITFLVRNPSKENQLANLYYAQSPDYMSLDEKWNWLESLDDITSSILEEVPITDKHYWLDLPDETFDEMIPVCDTKKHNEDTAVRSHALGVTAACDAYLYSFNRDKLIEKVCQFVDTYNDTLDKYLDELDQLKENDIKKKKEDILKDITANTKLDVIKWTAKLKGTLRKRQHILFDESRIREVLYRPFTKLWLYEDDRILSSVKTVSAMFPRDGDESAVETGGGVGEFSSRVPPTWPSSEPSRPRYTETSRQQEQPKLPESSPDGDSDQQRQQYDFPSSGDGAADGSGGDQGFAADAGDTAPELAGGGGGGNSHHMSFQQGGLRDSRNRGHQRSLRGGNATGVPGRSPAEGLMVTGPSNMAREGVLATGWLPDLHTMAAGQQTRVLPRWRRF